MALIVQKFGGTSVGDIERIKNVANIVKKTVSRGHKVVLVVSAMAGETNRLVALTNQIQEIPDEREYDVVVASGEQVAIGLVAMALKEKGLKAKSYLGFQVPIITDNMHSRAKIKKIETKKLKEDIKKGIIPVIAGFQGVTEDGDITTLGRGGSDTSAVAIAAALKADVCEIYTDVEGVYTTDPRICESARLIDKISYEEMLEMANLGAKVMHLRAVEIGMLYGIPIHVRSSFNDREGTWIIKEEKMEKSEVTAVTYDKNQAKVTILKVKDRPGIAAKLFKPVSEAGINVDMIVQNVSTGGYTDLTFTVQRTDLKKVVKILEPVVKEIGAEGIVSDDKIAKVSIVGVGMASSPGIAAKMFETLAQNAINIQMISTSEIKISCVIDEKYTELAVRVLHEAFDLGKKKK